MDACEALAQTFQISKMPVSPAEAKGNNRGRMPMGSTWQVAPISKNSSLNMDEKISRDNPSPSEKRKRAGTAKRVFLSGPAASPQRNSQRDLHKFYKGVMLCDGDPNSRYTGPSPNAPRPRASSAGIGQKPNRNLNIVDVSPSVNRWNELQSTTKVDERGLPPKRPVKCQGPYSLNTSSNGLQMTRPHTADDRNSALYKGLKRARRGFVAAPLPFVRNAPLDVDTRDHVDKLFSSHLHPPQPFSPMAELEFRSVSPSNLISAEAEVSDAVARLTGRVSYAPIDDPTYTTPKDIYSRGPTPVYVVRPYSPPTESSPAQQPAVTVAYSANKADQKPHFVTPKEVDNIHLMDTSNMSVEDRVFNELTLGRHTYSEYSLDDVGGNPYIDENTRPAASPNLKHSPQTQISPPRFHYSAPPARPESAGSLVDRHMPFYQRAAANAKRERQKPTVNFTVIPKPQSGSAIFYKTMPTMKRLDKMLEESRRQSRELSSLRTEIAETRYETKYCQSAFAGPHNDDITRLQDHLDDLKFFQGPHKAQFNKVEIERWKTESKITTKLQEDIIEGDAAPEREERPSSMSRASLMDSDPPEKFSDLEVRNVRMSFGDDGTINECGEEETNSNVESLKPLPAVHVRNVEENVFMPEGLEKLQMQAYRSEPQSALEPIRPSFTLPQDVTMHPVGRASRKDHGSVKCIPHYDPLTLRNKVSTAQPRKEHTRVVRKSIHYHSQNELLKTSPKPPRIRTPHGTELKDLHMATSDSVTFVTFTDSPHDPLTVQPINLDVKPPSKPDNNPGRKQASQISIRKQENLDEQKNEVDATTEESTEVAPEPTQVLTCRTDKTADSSVVERVVRPEHSVAETDDMTDNPPAEPTPSTNYVVVPVPSVPALEASMSGELFECGMEDDYGLQRVVEPEEVAKAAGNEEKFTATPSSPHEPSNEDTSVKSPVHHKKRPSSSLVRLAETISGEKYDDQKYDRGDEEGNLDAGSALLSSGAHQDSDDESPWM